MQEFRPEAQPGLPQQTEQDVIAPEQPVETDGEDVEQEISEERPATGHERPKSTPARARIAPRTRVAAVPTQPMQKDAATVAVEEILQEGLEGLYASLPPNEQAAFRQKGEETAGEIVTILRSARVRVERVLQLVVQWLKTIPGVNVFFLEQEAKIKTDRMMTMSEKWRDGGGGNA